MNADAAVTIGNRMIVTGGYDFEPAWPTNRTGGCAGAVVDFIPVHNELPAAVVAPDDELVPPDGAGTAIGTEVRGWYLILELGRKGTDWATPEPRVHVELCRTRPEPKTWKDRAQGAWVESHATWRLDSSSPP